LAIIENYLREVSRLLRPGRLFKLEVLGGAIAPPGNPELPKARHVRLLQDRDNSQLEPQVWVGISVSPEAASRIAERTGFELRYHHDADQQNYWLWLFKV
jgi:hypothetical protein